ncbi:hypothetical protein ABZW44_47965, partial [Streptomyces mirabilis]|uniref:hypothetical protein n=1 Tax=Streptomyces mirabilis TaxID=68239 RepID=UPI0033A1C7B8
SCLRVTIVFLPDLPSMRIRIGKIDHDLTQALAALLGHPAPYWFHTLRDRDAIASWRPGAPPAVVPAHDIVTPVSALVELAADEPDGSPAAELCWYLAREVRHRGHASVTRNIAELRKNAAEGGDGAHLVLGAVPAPLSRPAPKEPPELVRRAGWLSITERRDVLAHRVADFAQRWDGGQEWHTGAVTSVSPGACTIAHEWAQRLEPADAHQPPTVLEKGLLDNGRDADTDVLLHDPVAGIPVLHSAPGTRRALVRLHPAAAAHQLPARRPRPQPRRLLDPYPGRHPVACA